MSSTAMKTTSTELSIASAPTHEDALSHCVTLAHGELQDEGRLWKVLQRQARKGLASIQPKRLHFDLSNLPIDTKRSTITSSRCQILAKEDREDEGRVMRAILRQTHAERTSFEPAAVPRTCSSYHCSALARDEKAKEASFWKEHMELQKRCGGKLSPCSTLAHSAGKGGVVR